jgi:hypothetical protein
VVRVIGVWALVVATLFSFGLTGCGGGGGDSGGSSGSGSGGGSSVDWYYHWSCNGDPDCLATNPTGQPSGTLNQGPVQINCTQLLQFAARFWGPAATNSCDNSPTGPPPVLKSITVTPASKVLPLGLTQQYSARGNYSDGSSADITSQVHWFEGNDTINEGVTPVAQVTGAGLATATKAGTTTISARLLALTGSASLTVTAATLVSMTVSPTNPTVNQFLTQQFTATGHYTDGSAQTLTSVTWSSGTTAVATITASGLATAVLGGTSTITATSGTISASTLLTVNPVSLQSITVTPANPSSPRGTTLQFTATGTYSDGQVKDVSPQVTWASDTTSVATISTSGLSTANNLGTSNIAASFAGISGSTTLTVTAAVLQSIAITPTSPSVAESLTKQLTATGTYSDATTQDLTSQVTWTSATSSVATVSSGGVASGVSAGTSLIRAASGSISGTATLTVVALGAQWTPSTSGTSNALFGIAWSGTQFVAVGAGGTVLTSPDGLTWTARMSGTAQQLHAVVWAANQFVAVGTAGTILTSPDGITWTGQASGVSASLNAVTWTGTQIVAVGNSQVTVSSPTGITWASIVPFTAGNDFHSICWSGTRFVEGVGPGNGIATSTDASTLVFVSALTPWGCTWTGTHFIMVASSGVIWVSTDGLAFNSVHAGSFATLRAVAWSGRYFVAVGDGGAVSTAPDDAAHLTTNGTPWTPRTSGTTSTLRGIAWSGTRFVAVGDAGTIVITTP